MSQKDVAARIQAACQGALDVGQALQAATTQVQCGRLSLRTLSLPLLRCPCHCCAVPAHSEGRSGLVHDSAVPVVGLLKVACRLLSGLGCYTLQVQQSTERICLQPPTPCPAAQGDLNAYRQALEAASRYCGVLGCG